MDTETRVQRGPRVPREPALEPALQRLMQWVEARDYTGYDLYDGLSITRSETVLRSYWANTLITQFFKKSPVNLRPLFGMPKTKMPMGAGLFLHAYALLAGRARREGDDEQARRYLDRCEELYRWLVRQNCPNYSGYAWNFGFNYKFMFDKPTVVITAMVARGMYAYYRLTGREEVRHVLRSICDFVLRDLLVTEADEGICFSYTPQDNPERPKMLDCCYNASMLGAEILAQGYALTGEAPLRDRALRAADFTVAHQHADGRWNYSIDLQTGRERPQVDFHQGFILDSLHAIMHHTGARDQSYQKALERGADFYYAEQFASTGRARWRLPKNWPADIHCQAQGIITFSSLAHLSDRYGPFARTIAEWTVAQMQDETGYFYHRKGRFMTNRIPYMRWGQAWMMIALAHLVAGAGEKTVTSAPGEGKATATL